MEYYLRIRGKVHGPYTEQQVLGMRTKGSISRTTEISEDEYQWLPAAAYAFLYPQPVTPVSELHAAPTTLNPRPALVQSHKPFADRQPSRLWQRIGGIVALAALLAAITLGVGIFALLQEPTPPPNKTPPTAVTPNDTPPPAQNETPVPEGDSIPPSDPFVAPNTEDNEGE